MRILHTLPGRNWGGMEHRTLEQVRWLCDHGHEAFIAAPPGGAPAERAIAMGLPFTPLEFSRPFRSDTLGGLRRLVKEHRIQLIDAHGTRDLKAAFFCRGLCAIVRTRHVTHKLKTSWLRRMQWRHGSDHLIANSAAVATMLRNSGLVIEDRFSVVSAWAEQEYFTPPPGTPSREAMREALGIPPDAFAVFNFSMHRVDKCQDVLLRAMVALGERAGKAVCVLVGGPTEESTEYGDSLPALARELGLGDKVIFTGLRKDVAAILPAADVVVIASYIESQPRVAAQTLAVGRPLVGTDIGGIPELINDGVTGWLVPVGDPEAMAETLFRVATNPAATAQIAANARAWAETGLRFDTKMAETLAVYDKAMAHAAKRRAKFVMGDGGRGRD
ncbi:MAG: glycosyltransferase family 4 protein [Alphaproteobacteria bacterium]|nr:glycosyltransferase family 4 protein [Alphaproteobacteria bacterium]